MVPAVQGNINAYAGSIENKSKVYREVSIQTDVRFSFWNYDDSRKGKRKEKQKKEEKMEMTLAIFMGLGIFLGIPVVIGLVVTGGYLAATHKKYQAKAKVKEAVGTEKVKA